MTIYAPQPLKSHGIYLTLTDAIEIIGRKCVDGWSKNDREQLEAVSSDGFNQAAHERCSEAAERLKNWIVGNQIAVFGSDDEGALYAIEASRTSKPYFDINIPKSQFKWAPDDWAPIFVDRRSLNVQLTSIRKAKPRKRKVFQWEKIASIAWKAALAMPSPRAKPTLMARIKQDCIDEFEVEPGDKELRLIVDDIIDHLDGRTLSREVLGP